MRAPAPARRAALAALAALALLAGPVRPAAAAALEPGCVLAGADYSRPTDRYDHGVLGDALEWGGLRLRLSCPGTAAALREVVLPETMVFEDSAPRLADVTGDGAPEVIVVETALARGARLAIWGLSGGQVARLDATPFIGRPYRWLAPLGAADLDGDGTIEVAWIDRPHLARRLVVQSWRDGALRPFAEAEGVTAHRIGDPQISGGIRTCGAGPELVLADPDWTRLLGLSWTGAGFARRDLGPIRGAQSFAAALDCSAAR